MRELQYRNTRYAEVDGGETIFFSHHTETRINEEELFHVWAGVLRGGSGPVD